MEPLLDPTYNSLSPSELSQLLKHNDVDNHIFVLSDTNDFEGGSILFGCLFESPPRSQLKTLVKSTSRGFCILRNDFKSLSSLSIVFTDLLTTDEGNCTKSPSGCRVSSLDLNLSASRHDPLISMSEIFQSLLVRGLNKYYVGMLWRSMKNGSLSNNSDLLTLVESSACTKLGYLKFMNPILRSIAETGRSILPSLQTLPDVEIRMFVGDKSLYEVIIVDTNIQVNIGLRIVLSTVEDISRIDLLQYSDDGMDQDIIYDVQRSIIDKIVNTLIYLSFS